MSASCRHLQFFISEKEEKTKNQPQIPVVKQDLLVEAILFRVVLPIVALANFEYKVAQMTGSDLNWHIDPRTCFVLPY